jgi:hypothetical protein
LNTFFSPSISSDRPSRFQPLRAVPSRHYIACTIIPYHSAPFDIGPVFFAHFDDFIGHDRSQTGQIFDQPPTVGSVPMVEAPAAIPALVPEPSPSFVYHLEGAVLPDAKLTPGDTFPGLTA